MVIGSQSNITHEVRAAQAEMEIERLKYQQQTTGDQMLKMSSWLMASLLFINSGGVVSAMNISKNIGGSIVPQLFFVAGIIFVMFNGVIIQKIQSDVAEVIPKLHNVWAEYRLSGIYRDDRYLDANKEIDNAYRFSFLAPLMGWLSGICFITGVLSTGYFVNYYHNRHERICASIQSDLGQRDRKLTNGSELFTTFGCLVDPNLPISALVEAKARDR